MPALQKKKIQKVAKKAYRDALLERLNKYESDPKESILR